jgi:fatty-acyl-CoA synthase
MNHAAGEFIQLDWFKKWSEYSPNKVAIKDGETGRQLTYSELYRETLKTTKILSEQYQIKKGDRVAVLATNELEFVFLFFSLQRLGAVFVPVNFRLTAREISYIVNDCQPSLLLFQEEFRKTVQDLELNFECRKKLFTKSLSEDNSFAEQSANVTEATEVLAKKFSFASEFEDENMILYTSGTTGFPKGAVLTFKSIYWNSINTSISLNLTQNDCAVIFLPFFHTGGWNVLTTPILHRGGTLIFLKKFDAQNVLKLSSQDKATLLFGVPTTMDMMAQQPNFNEIDLKTLRFAIVGGEPMPVELIKKWQQKGVDVRQGYGLTEFGPNVFSLPQADSVRKIGSIGFANFYVEVDIFDENGKSLAAEEIGELVLKGPMAMKGYWKNPKATDETIKNGWLHTGDLVRKDREGYFYVVGRKKDMFISGAENVYPAEIEQILRQLPQIAEAAVIGVEDARWGEVGKAFISLHKGTSLTESEILEHCSKNLAKYKIPKYFVFIDSLPKGDSGKILKKNLPK